MKLILKFLNNSMKINIDVKKFKSLTQNVSEIERCLFKNTINF